MTDDRAAIEALLFEYARRVDAGDFDGVGALFERGALRAGDSVLRGAEVADVMRAMVRVGGDGTPGTKHVVTNVTVVVDGATATADSYFTVLQALPGAGIQPIVAGRYADRFERSDDAWHFSERVVHTDLVGDVSGHLTTDPF